MLNGNGAVCKVAVCTVQYAYNYNSRKMVLMELICMPSVYGNSFLRAYIPDGKLRETLEEIIDYTSTELRVIL
jgi:CRISPR/Cas system CSM-associated protein Csm2 small subunit